MNALGLADSLSHASDLVRIAEVRHPDPDNAATYAALLPLFADLYDDLMPAFRTLSHPERERRR
jgi:gluconokinase